MDVECATERRHEAPERPSDFRTPYQRDHARLVHSSAFRRLQAKTQVLGLGESDFYRTRLTHSMEVAQIGTAITTKLRWDGVGAQCLDPGELFARALINAVCLAHDIGHPPFGHGGELALNHCMRENGGFEGNGQTLRILSRLDKYSEEYGLNPTRRMLLGVLKYPISYSEAFNRSRVAVESGSHPWIFSVENARPPKCYLDTEREIVEWILSGLPEGDGEWLIRQAEEREGKHKKARALSLDASIMDLADDISYGVHDLEDAVALGIIRREDWEQADARTLFEECRLNYAEVTEGLFGNSSAIRKDKIGSLINTFVTQSELRQVDGSEAESPLIHYNVLLPEETRLLLDHLKDFVFQKMVMNDNVKQLEFKGRKIVVEVFSALKEEPRTLLPGSTLSRYEKSDEDPRVVCDYVAGMTDDYIVRLYEKIFMPRKGSIFERI